jgi:hypothetical protein
VDADSFEISHQYCFYLFRIKRENMVQMRGVTTNPNLVLGGGFRELARFTCLEDVNSYQNNLTGFTESDNIKCRVSIFTRRLFSKIQNSAKQMVVLPNFACFVKEK